MQNIDNSRFNALIKLALWGIFIVFLLIIINIGGKNNDEKPLKDDTKVEEKVLTYEEKFQKLNDNYTYEYDLKIGDNLYYFKGEVKEGREVGTKTFNGETIEYFKENNYNYQVIAGGLNKIDNLYEGIDETLLDITNLKNMLKDQEYQEKDNSYEYLLADKTITVYTNKENIMRINITIGSDYYDLAFNDIGLVKEIKY